MSKKRLNEIARELGISSKEVVAKALELGFEVKSHASSVDEASAKRLADSFAKKA
ncbi:translation initiation factor IF-2 N-terminal domain-containing protein, partial [Streptococcus suis]